MLIADQALAHLENAFELTREYTSERKAFGGSLSRMQTIRHKMADIKTDIVTCRVLVDECIEQFENVSFQLVVTNLKKSPTYKNPKDFQHHQIAWVHTWVTEGKSVL